MTQRLPKSESLPQASQGRRGKEEEGGGRGWLEASNCNNSSIREEKISGQWQGVAKSFDRRALEGSEELVSKDWVTPAQ